MIYDFRTYIERRNERERHIGEYEGLVKFISFRSVCHFWQSQANLLLLIPGVGFGLCVCAVLSVL